MATGWDAVPDIGTAPEATGWDAVPDGTASRSRVQRDMMQSLPENAGMVKPQEAPSKPRLIDRIAYSTPVQAITDIPLAAAQLTLAGPDTIAGIPTTGLDMSMPGTRAALREWVQKQINDREAQYRSLPENQNFLGDINRGVINMVAGGRLMPGMVSPGTNIMAQGAAGAMVQPSTGGSEDVAKNKLIQGAIGAGTAGALNVAGKGLVKAVPAAQKVITKIQNYRKGNMNPEAAEALALGEKFGVRMSGGDVGQSAALKKTEVALENVPGVGMSGFRKAQNEEAEAAAQRVLKDLGDKLEGEDFNLGIAKGTRAKLAKVTAKASQMYDEIGKLAGNKEAPRRNILDVVQRARADNARAGVPDAALENELATIERRLTQTATEAERAGEIPMNRSYDGLRALRSEFGKSAKKYQNSDAPMSALYWELKHAAGKDLSEFAENVPQLAQRQRMADRFYSKVVAPLKPASKDYGDWARKLTGKEVEPEAIYNFFVQAGKEGKAKYFYNALDQNGKSAVRYGIVDEAMRAAKNKAGSPAPFSPARFAKSLRDNGEAVGVFFKGKDKWEIDGFRTLMEHVERAGQFAENPPTGNRLAHLATGGAGFTVAALTGHVPEAAALWGSAKLLKILTTTKGGQQFLFAASSMKPGSKELSALVQRRLPQLLAGSADSAASTAPNVQPFRPAPLSPGMVAESDDSQPSPPMAALY